jgi:hypothetical protein
MFGISISYNLVLERVERGILPLFICKKGIIMATAKKTVKTTKRVVKKVDDLINIVEEQKPITDEDKILGVNPIVETKKEFNYESPMVQYKVTNLVLKNKPITVNGAIIEAFIGSKNLKAREQLKEGVKEVITYNGDKKEQYKIEVL